MDGVNTFSGDQIKDLQTIVKSMLAPNAGDKKISALGAIPLVADADLFAVVDLTDTVTKKATALQTKDYVNAGKAGGKTIDGGTLTTQTLILRNNAIDDLGFDLRADGILRSNVPNYETLVLHDDDVVNKKYADDLVSAAGIITKDLTSQLGLGSVTSFILDTTPAVPAIASLFYNGTRQIYGINFTITGTTLTWIATPSPRFALSEDDGTNSFWIEYEKIVTPVVAPAAFKAQVDSDHVAVTGDGTAYIVLFQDDSTTGFYDLQNTYTPATGQYTAAYAQIFSCAAALLLGGTINATHEVTALFAHRNSGGSVISTTTFTENKAGVIVDSTGNIIVSGYADFKLSTGDTVEVAVIGAGSTKTINVINTSSQFYGHVVSPL